MSDLFRTTYKSLSAEEVKNIAAIKSCAQDLSNLITEHGTGGRETALAITKLEESVMWAVKGFTK